MTDCTAIMNPETLTRLHAGLTARRTPQEVAADLTRTGTTDAFTGSIHRELAELGRYWRDWGYGTSMNAGFRTHPGLERAFTATRNAIAQLLGQYTGPADTAALTQTVDATSPAALALWLDQAISLLGMSDAPVSPVVPARKPKPKSNGWYTLKATPNGRRGDSHGHVDVRERLDASSRRDQLPGVSVRTYRKAVRAVAHLQQRTAVLAAERDREVAIAFGKGRLAHTIDATAFGECAHTAAFVAYYVARLGMRTLFTNGAQDRPMDTVAEQMLTAALACPGSRADVIATVLTRQAILSRLSEQGKGELLGAYYEQLTACSRALSRTFDPNRDRTSMTVREGDDSSTWNAASRAFNQARTGWLNLTRSLGLGDVVEARCPGKVPALVASDVAHWHSISGSDTHADTAVFAELPNPWDVVLGSVDCPAELVRTVCSKHGLDADATGWTAAYRQRELEQVSVAADLVHGVTIASPLLAGILRDAGFFSGQAQSKRQQALADGLLTLAQPAT